MSVTKAKKPRHTERVPSHGDKIHIPLSEREAVRVLGKVKPTADMPRQGASGKKKTAPKQSVTRKPKLG